MSKAWVRLVLGGIAGVAAVWLAAGCYHKVVGAEGFGADQVQIEQGNLDDSPKTLGYRSYKYKPMPGSGSN